MFKRKRKVLALADLHILSKYGLSTEEYVGEAGTILKASEGQLRLLSYWKHLCKTVNKRRWKPAEIWLVGDLFAGTDYKERGRKKRGSLDEQVDVAKTLVKLLPKKVPIKIWSGTPYHESMDTLMHKNLVADLKGDGHKKVQFKGNWSIEHIEKTKAFVTHHASSAVVYPHTPMVRDSRWFKIRAFDGKLPKIDWIVRAHKHESIFIDDRGIHIIQLPCWQAFTPYKGSLRMFPSYQPDFGGTFLWTEDGRRQHQEWLYPPFLIDDFGEIIETGYDENRYVTGW